MRKSYLSWCPTSCAYTSSAPSAQPHGRVRISYAFGSGILWKLESLISNTFFDVALPQQGIRKVLDVKFHPEGLPQLVSSSNEVSAIYDSCFIYYSRIPCISYYC